VNVKLVTAWDPTTNELNNFRKPVAQILSHGNREIDNSRLPSGICNREGNPGHDPHLSDLCVIRCLDWDDIGVFRHPDGLTSNHSSQLRLDNSG
jgi:hypothetical protein